MLKRRQRASIHTHVLQEEVGGMRMCLFVSTAVDSDEDVQQGDTKHDDLTGFAMVKLNMGFNHQLNIYIYTYTVYIYIYCWLLPINRLYILLRNI